MFCGNCGKQIINEAVFCPECGFPVGKPNPAAPTPAAPIIGEQPAPVMTEQPAPVMAEQPAPVMPEQPAPVITEQPAPVITEQPAPVITEQHAPVMAEQPAPIPEMQNVYPAVEQPKKVRVKKQWKKAPTPVIVLLSIVFGLFVFVFEIYGSIGLSVSSALSSNSISENVSESNPAEVVIGDILTNNKITEQLENSGVDVNGIDDDMTLADFVVYLSHDYSIDSDAVAGVLEDSKIMPYIGEVVKAYEDYILTGKSDSPLSKSKIMKVIDGSEKVIQKYCAYSIKLSENREYISEMISQNFSSIGDGNPDNVIGDFGGFTSVALNPIVVIAVLVLAAGFIVLVWVTTKSVPAMLMTGGSVSLVVGLALLAATLFTDSIVGLFIKVDKSLRGFVFDIIAPITDALRLEGIIITAVGLLLIAGFVVIKVVAKKNTAQAVPQQ